MRRYLPDPAHDKHGFRLKPLPLREATRDGRPEGVEGWWYEDRAGISVHFEVETHPGKCVVSAEIPARTIIAVAEKMKRSRLPTRARGRNRGER